MRKFYLKIEKEKWTAEGGPGGKKGSYTKKGTEVVDPLWNVKWAVEHIPEGHRRRRPAWNWNTNGPEDGLEMWRAIGDEHEATRRRRNVSRLCAASWLCEKRPFQTELNQTRFLTTRAQLGFVFLNRQHFVFSSIFFFFVYSKQYIYNFNLFI